MKSFTDHDGREWTPRFTTPVILGICERLQIDIDKIFEGILFLVKIQIGATDDFAAVVGKLSRVHGDRPALFKIGISDLVYCLWLTCEKQAFNKEITRNRFFENVATPDKLGEIGLCCLENFVDAFPQLKKHEPAQETGSVPLPESGQPILSLNTADVQEEAQEKT